MTDTGKDRTLKTPAGKRIIMKIMISGLYGHMGRILYDMIQEKAELFTVSCGVSLDREDVLPVPCYQNFAEAENAADLPETDLIIDFSHHACTKELTEFAVSHRLPLVLATTGQTEEELAMIRKAAESIPLFFASNYSLGIAILTELAKKTAALMPDAEIEIVEKHHDRKIDAPSGTALSIASALQEVRTDSELVLGRSGQGKRKPSDIGIHAIRMGNIVGEHEVIIGTQNQTITLKHEAHSRALFAEGALTAAAWLINQPAGLYGMKEMLN